MSSQCELETLPAQVQGAPSKKPKISENYRQWSEDAETCKDPITHYTIKVYYGDPEQKLPSRIRLSKKENIIHQMITCKGFRREECVGTKDQLLQKLQRCLPFVTFKIDGREGIQRVLNTALRQFGWSCDHMYTATMPLRGTSTVGTDTYLKILLPELRFDLDDICPSRYAIKDRINRHFAHLLPQQRDDMLEDVMDMDITTGLSQLAPKRSFRGSSLQLETRMHCDIFDKRYMDMFFMSMNDLAFRKGDRIYFDYDDGYHFIAEIVQCEENQQLLPEIFSHPKCAAVRALVVEESSMKIPLQYPMSDDYDEMIGFDSLSDY
jgi:hypothetical protein